MKLIKLARNWKSTLSANLLLAAGLTGSVMVNMALTAKLATSHERIVLVPPMMTKETVVGWNEASKNFFEGWGLYTATMIGSVTPKTASFVANHLQFVFDPSIYPAVKTQLLSIEKDPSYTRTGSVNIFTPRQVTWEASTQRLFVSGDLATTAYRGSFKTLANVAVTYQMTMEMQAGSPKILSFTSYTGQARTLKWEREHPSEVAKVQKARDAKEATIVPQESDIQRALEAGEGSTEQINAPAEDGEPQPATPPQKKQTVKAGNPTNAAPAPQVTHTAPAVRQPGSNRPNPDSL